MDANSEHDAPSAANPGRARGRSAAVSRLVSALLLGGAAALVGGCSGDPLGVLPEAASPEALEVDRLTYGIIWLTGGVLVGVQLVLLWFLFKYRARPGGKAKFTHGNHTVELVWTIAPALVLVVLAVYQADLWLTLKAPQPDELGDPVRVQIFAKQFEWNFRYPGPDDQFGTDDDLVTVGAMVVPVDRVVLADMRSMDVLHSFYLPNLRFKQDAVPGLSIPIWFRSDKKSADRQTVRNSKGEDVQLNYWDIVCAELCGKNHTSMSGQLFVVSENDFQAWLAGNPMSAQNVPGYSTNANLEGTTEWQTWSRWADQDVNQAVGKPRWTREPFGPDDKGVDAVSDDEEDF